MRMMPTLQVCKNRHNHVGNILFQTALQAGLMPVREPVGLLPGSDDRPADAILKTLLLMLRQSVLQAASVVPEGAGHCGEFPLWEDEKVREEVRQRGDHLHPPRSGSSLNRQNTALYLCYCTHLKIWSLGNSNSAAMGVILCFKVFSPAQQVHDFVVYSSKNKVG